MVDEKNWIECITSSEIDSITGYFTTVNDPLRADFFLRMIFETELQGFPGR